MEGIQQDRFLLHLGMKINKKFKLILMTSQHFNK